MGNRAGVKIAKLLLSPASASFLGLTCLAHATISPVTLETTYSGAPVSTVQTSDAESRDLSDLSGLTPGQTIQVQFIPSPQVPLKWSGTFTPRLDSNVWVIDWTAFVVIKASGQQKSHMRSWGFASNLPHPTTMERIAPAPTPGPDIYTLNLPWGTDLSNVTIELFDRSSLPDGTFTVSSMRVGGILRTVSVPDGFIVADANSSQALDKAEFATTLEEGAPDKTVNRQFKKADRDKNNMISLTEYLVHTGAKEAPTKIEASFTAADTDSNGSIDFFEFQEASPPKSPLVSMLRSFLLADDDGNEALSSEEWTRLKTGKAKPEKGERYLQFDLADANGDDQITVDEFFSVFPRGTTTQKVWAKFLRLEKSDDGVLTRDEWNPGGR